MSVNILPDTDVGLRLDTGAKLGLGVGLGTGSIINRTSVF